MAHSQTGKSLLSHFISFTMQSNISLSGRCNYNLKMKANKTSIKNSILLSSLFIAQVELAKIKLNTIKNINPKYSLNFSASFLQVLA